MKRLLALILLAVCFTAPITRAQASSEDGDTALISGQAVTDSLDAQADSLLAQYDSEDSPGAVVGVIRDGEVAFAKGYGMADLAHGIPITPATRFNIGSVSKQFLGFAFALLAEQGKLSLDDPVREHLPDWPTFEETVTLRHLLTHTSGYREAYGTVALAGRIPGQDRLPREETLDVVRRQTALEFPAGSEFQYNSTAYVILAEVFEQVTGRPAGKWLEENVFAPLGMEHSAIESEVGEIIPEAAHSYTDAKEDGYKRETSNRAIFGAAEVFTTVEDLAKWLQNFHTAELGGPAVQRRMREPSVFTTGDTSNYALGLFIDERRGLRRISHTGGHAGFRTQLRYYPDLEAGVVVMSNYDGINTGRVANKIAETAFGEYMESPQAAPAPERVSVDTTLLAKYAGKYRAEDGQVYTVRRKQDTLFVIGMPLIPLSDRVFKVKNRPYRVSFHSTKDGGVRRAELHTPREKTNLRRIESWHPIPEELEVYAGRYYSPELETIYAFSVADSQLVAHHRWRGKMPFTPIEKDAFRAENGMRIQFERNKVGVLTGYYATLGRTRDVWFQKRD